MIRLSTQFDRAVTRPIVAAPKSSGCCCCCCCCIVTVVGFSIVTARSTSRALGPGAKPVEKKPARPVMDGWSTRPVEGAAPEPPSEPEPTSPAAEEHPFGAPDRWRWVALAALLLPLSLCIVPAILAGIAELISNGATTDFESRAAELVPTGVAVLLFAGLTVLLRRYVRWGGLGIGLTSALMAVSVASAFLLDAYFAAPLVLSVTMYVGGLVALARRGVPRKTLIVIGALVPFALAIEFAGWLAIVAAS